MSQDKPPTLDQIRAIERGSTGEPPKPDDRQKALVEAVATARQQAGMEADLDPDDLGSMLAMGATGEVPPVTIGGIAVLEVLGSPYLDTPTDGKLTVTTLDTARGLYALACGPVGCAPLLSAMALDRAADCQPEEFATPLRSKACALRGGWDAAALKNLELCGKSKMEIDTEIIVRLRDILHEMEALR